MPGRNSSNAAIVVIMPIGGHSAASTPHASLTSVIRSPATTPMRPPLNLAIFMTAPYDDSARHPRKRALGALAALR